MSTSIKRKIGGVYDEPFPDPTNQKRIRTRMQLRLAAKKADTATIGGSHTASSGIGLATDSNDAAATSPVAASSSTLGDEKPLAIDRPPVWSFNRGALGDSTEYMKRHEGGNYHKDGVTMGMLIDANGTLRDFIDGTVIITSV